jgi:Cu(I)/Ag(I) efflux system periplasmic protein CusF
MTTNRLTRLFAALLAGAALTAGAWAQTSVELTQGEVRKVDTAASKVTIKHGDIKNLDMPAMTMVFQVRDPALLAKVKAGDAVRFHAERGDGTYIVTSMEVVKK